MKDSEIYFEIAKLLSQGEKCVLATVTRTQGSTPRKAGAKMLIQENGTFSGSIGGGCVEAEVYAKAKEQFSKSKPSIFSFVLNETDAANFGLRCGGTIDVYMERIMPKNIFYLVGAGHISFALSKILDMVGFEVHVVDDNPSFANSERFPNAVIHLGSFEDGLDSVPEGEQIGILIATRGHAEDSIAIKKLAKKRFGYFGIITSKKRLIELGTLFVSAGGSIEKVERISAPAGLDIGAETPEEIAVAVTAEVLCAFRGGNYIPLSEQFRKMPAGKKLRELIEKNLG
ncbi:TPA: xanthine dehydrogenase [bacterium]|nr:MAG: hypothetical protein AUJ18_01820 [Candidatus Hydrogenedentes bacterium CG1_02_42_14]PIU47547.1 MAG: xanthine dehydrogenase [Candidatus Hydrogenedentes bacterium CG07_land_8_20_14_0_80_42_17]HBW47149.1 xanthine dehydrogenase [bacterium]